MGAQQAQPRSSAQRVDGYRTLEYVRTLGHIGEPMALPQAGGFLLQRAWKGGTDGCAPYPLLVCDQPAKLVLDLDTLAQEGPLVSVTAVCDPMATALESDWRRAFPDLWSAYKAHFVVDLDKPWDTGLSGHHARKVRRGNKRVKIEWAQGPGLASWCSEWQGLYAALIARHQIEGPAAFPAPSLAQQLQVPGACAVRARIEDRTVSMVLWYPAREGMRYHLAGTLAEGYEASATYALFAAALERFQAEGRAWVHLGAGAGIRPDETSGLTAFKAGWTAHTRMAYLGGRIVNPERYGEWTQQAGVDSQVAYFPAYRAGAGGAT